MRRGRLLAASAPLIVMSLACGTGAPLPPIEPTTYTEQSYTIRAQGARLRECVTVRVETRFNRDLPDDVRPHFYEEVTGATGRPRGNRTIVRCADVETPLVGLCEGALVADPAFREIGNAILRRELSDLIDLQIRDIGYRVSTHVFDPEALDGAREDCGESGGTWTEHPDNVASAEAAQGTPIMRRRIQLMRQAR